MSNYSNVSSAQEARLEIRTIHNEFEFETDPQSTSSRYLKSKFNLLVKTWQFQTDGSPSFYQK